MVMADPSEACKISVQKPVQVQQVISQLVDHPFYFYAMSSLVSHSDIMLRKQQMSVLLCTALPANTKYFILFPP